MLSIRMFNNYFKQLTLFQKIALLYCVLIFLIAAFVPIISIQHLDNTLATQIRLIHSDFWIIDILLIVILIKCILYVISLEFKSLVLHMTGIKIDSYAIPLICLVMMSCIILSIGATTITLKNELTYMVNLTYGYYIVCILLIIGIGITGLMIVRDLKIKPQSDSIIVSKKPHIPTPTLWQWQVQTHVSDTPKIRSSLFEDI